MHTKKLLPLFFCRLESAFRFNWNTGDTDQADLHRSFLSAIICKIRVICVLISFRRNTDDIIRQICTDFFSLWLSVKSASSAFWFRFVGTQMTQIRQICTDFFYPRLSVKSASSAFRFNWNTGDTDQADLHWFFLSAPSVFSPCPLWLIFLPIGIRVPF